MAASTAVSEVMESFCRCSSGASSTKRYMNAARSTEGVAPAKGTKKRMTAMLTHAAVRFLRTSSRMKPTRNATFIPDTATTCKIPARAICA